MSWKCYRHQNPIFSLEEQWNRTFNFSSFDQKVPENNCVLICWVVVFIAASPCLHNIVPLLVNWSYLWCGKGLLCIVNYSGSSTTFSHFILWIFLQWSVTHFSCSSGAFLLLPEKWEALTFKYSNSESGLRWNPTASSEWVSSWVFCSLPHFISLPKEALCIGELNATDVADTLCMGSVSDSLTSYTVGHSILMFHPAQPVFLPFLGLFFVLNVIMRSSPCQIFRIWMPKERTLSSFLLNILVLSAFNKLVFINMPNIMS